MVTVEQVVAEAGDLCRRLQASISQVTLNREASETKRQLWASQPALIRLATVWLVLASDDYDHFGLVYAAMFLVQGVHGMPALHVKGYPADAVGFMAQFNATHGHLGWKDKVNKVTALLPHNYGKDIAKKLYLDAVSITKNPALADDVMLKVFKTFYDEGKGEGITAGSAYNSALAYVKQAVKHTGLNEVKSPRNKNLRIDDPERGPEIVAPGSMGNEKFWQKVIEELHKSPELRKELAAVPKAKGDAAKFLELIAQGYDEKEIVGDYRDGIPSMLPHIDQSSPATGMTYQNWNQHIKPAILEVARKYFMKHVERA